MANERNTERVSGGLVDYPDNESLQAGQVQKSTNYERLGLGRVEKRREPETYSDDLQSTLNSTFDSIISMSPPYYPANKPDTMVNNFMLLFYGKINGSYALRLAYEKSGGWVAETLTGLSSDNVSYTADSDLEFNVGENMIIITDGVNNAHYITVDADGAIIVSGVLGIPAPTNKASVSQLTELDEQIFEENADADYLDEPGLFQCVYTVETETGEESNPSPVSETLNLQFFETNEDGETKRWIDQVTISNLSIPDVNNDIKERLEYFRVYYRIIYFSEGDTPSTLTFSKRFKILDKDNLSGTTGNAFTIKVPVDPGNTVEYNNNVAPIAKHSAQVTGFVSLGNLKTKATFPYDFEYYVPININNINTQSYADAVVTIKLYDENSGDADAITNLDWTDFDTDNDDYIDLGKVQDIRIYDEDLATPLNVNYTMDTSNGVLTAYIRIPQLAATLTRTIYLCFSANNTGNVVDDADYQQFDYGRFFAMGTDTWSNQEVYTAMKVWEHDSIVAAPCDLEDSSDYVYNRANLETNGEFTNVSWLSNPIAELDAFGSSYPVGEKALELIGANSQLPFEYEAGSTGELLPEMPEQGFVSLWIEYNADDLPTITGEGYARNILNLVADEENYLALQVWQDPNDSTVKWMITLEDNNNIHRFYGDSIGQVGGNRYKYHVILSWDNDGSLCVFFDGNKSTFSPSADLMEWTGVDLYIGGEGKYEALPMYVDDIQLVQNYYLSNIHEAWYLRNSQPKYESPIGYEYGGDHNTNISFEDTETFSLEVRENAYRWSKAGGLSFPANWEREMKESILRMIAVPSFLQFEYENTIGIFTRNTFARKVLNGDPETWVSRSDVLIEEFNQYGLLVPKSLRRIGESLIWLSEAGLIYWTKDLFRKISKEQLEIDITPDNRGLKTIESFFGAYVPARDQYWLHDQHKLNKEIEVGMDYQLSIGAGDFIMAQNFRNGFLLDDFEDNSWDTTRTSFDDLAFEVFPPASGETAMLTETRPLWENVSNDGHDPNLVLDGSGSRLLNLKAGYLQGDFEPASARTVPFANTINAPLTFEFRYAIHEPRDAGFIGTNGFHFSFMASGSWNQPTEYAANGYILEFSYYADPDEVDVYKVSGGTKSSINGSIKNTGDNVFSQAEDIEDGGGNPLDLRYSWRIEVYEDGADLVIDVYYEGSLLGTWKDTGTPKTYCDWIAFSGSNSASEAFDLVMAY